MKGLLWVLTLFALAVGVSLALQYNEGYVLLVTPPYRTELSLNLAILLCLGSFLLCYGLLRALALTRVLPRRASEFRQRRAQEKILENFYAAGRLLFEGRFSQAMKKADAAHAAGRSPALAALLAACAAQKLHQPARMREWLERAQQEDARMQAACLMLEAEMHITLRDFAAALPVLRHLQRIAGRHVAALLLELRAQQGCANWDEVLRITRLLEKHQALLPEVAQEIKRKAHQENLCLRRSALADLLAYRKAIPANEVHPCLTLALSEALIDLGAHAEASRQIEAQFDSEWDARLLRWYGRGDDDLAGCIARAGVWLTQHPDDPHVNLALGRMCRLHGLPDKAQSHLETALAGLDGRPAQAARLELALLCEQTGRADEALKHYRCAAGLCA